LAIIGENMKSRNHPRVLTVVLALCGVLLPVTACGTAKPAGLVGAATTTSPAAGELPQAAQLDTAIRKVMSQASVPGVIVGLWMPGKGQYVRAFGNTDKSGKTPMSTDLNTRIGSVTKTFTVTAILRLVDAGKLTLNDPIGKYISGVPQGDKITIKELAGMRSGLFSYTFDPGFQKALFSNPDRQFTPQELLAYGFKHDMVFPPGKNFQYSNTNTILLGLVVEKLSGQPLGTYLQQEVIAPAQMSHTIFPTGAEFPSPHAQGYTNQTLDGKVADATNWNPSWGWAAGSMISTLEDMRAWAPVLATGGTLLKPATQKERLPVASNYDAGLAYGLGILDSHGWLGHNGSLPGYQSLVIYLPSSKATLIVLANSDISYQGHALSTLFGKAVTEIVTPDNVYNLPAAPVTTASPTRS
jgi:D-alanyl-D-alanine carboxypeptidase